MLIENGKQLFHGIAGIAHAACFIDQKPLRACDTGTIQNDDFALGVGFAEDICRIYATLIGAAEICRKADTENILTFLQNRLHGIHVILHGGQRGFGIDFFGIDFIVKFIGGDILQFL